MKKSLLLLMMLASSHAASAGNCADGGTLKDVAIQNGFTTLVAAVVKADLVDFIDGNRNFTVFAPTNDAFDATAEDILGPGNDGIDLVAVLTKSQLTEVLYYHIAPGERYSSDVLDSRQVRMLDREFTYPSLASGVPYINDSEILMPDVQACNGVVHVIGSEILLPPSG